MGSPRSRPWCSSRTASPPPPRSALSRSRRSSARSASSRSRHRRRLGGADHKRPCRLCRCGRLVLLFINPRSGGEGPSAEELADEARRRGIEARVLEEDDDRAELARSASGPIGIAGGDGSLAPFAEAAIERDLPFVCIPLGTRNHFARDLGLDREDPTAALDAFEGVERRIDVGRVADRLFLNNVSIGAYAELVHRREHHRRRRNAFAQLRALVLLARHPSGEQLKVDGKPVDARIAFVGNNHYNLELFSIGERERLDEGLLHVYLAHGWRPSTWDEQTYERLTIDADQPRLRAAVDGEPTALDTPLDFSIEPRALRVLVPPR